MVSEKHSERRKGKRVKSAQDNIASNQSIDILFEFYFETKIAEGRAVKTIEKYRLIYGNMKQATIAKNTGYSRKTVNKALKTLEAYGVIDSVRTKTKKGRPSVKIVRILPFCLEKLQQAVTAIDADHAYGDNGLNMIEKFEPFKSESPKTLKEDKSTVTDIPFDQLDDSFVPKTIVANEFVQLAKPFFNAATIFKLWGNVKSVMKQSQLDFVSYDVMESVKEAFKSTVFMYKANRIKTTFDRYFVGALTNELVAIKRRELRDSIPNDSIFAYKWLNA